MKLHALLAVFFAIFSLSSALGGTGNEQVPMESENAIIAKLAPEIKGQAAKILTKFAHKNGYNVPDYNFDGSKIRIVSFKTQIVAGKNYFFKLEIDSTWVFHARVYVDFGNNAEVVKVIGPKSISHALEHFE